MSNKQISEDVLSNLIFTHYRWDVNLYNNFGKLFFLSLLYTFYDATIQSKCYF